MVATYRRLLALVLLSLTLAAGLTVVPTSPAYAAGYSAPLQTAIADLTVASEVRTG